MKSSPVFKFSLITLLLFTSPAMAQILFKGFASPALSEAKLLVQHEDFKGALIELDKASAAPNLTTRGQRYVQEFRDILRVNTAEPVDYSKSLTCVAPHAATPQQAKAIYKSLVAIEEPDRIRILPRGNSWLVFQGAILINGDSSKGYLGVPMEGAHHLAKVDMCGGSVQPDLDAQP